MDFTKNKKIIKKEIKIHYRRHPTEVDNFSVFFFFLNLFLEEISIISSGIQAGIVYCTHTHTRTHTVS